MNADPRLVKTLVGVYDFYGRELTEFAISVWVHALKDVPPETVEKALQRHLCDPDAGRFVPKPADVIRHLRGDADDAARIAWGEVLDLVRSAGSNGGHLLVGPAKQAVQSMGGFSVICRSQESELGFLQKRFLDAFQTYARLAENPPLVAVGCNVDPAKPSEALALMRGVLKALP